MGSASARRVAVLYAGDGAVVSHVTAAVLWGLIPAGFAPPVHVTVPVSRAPRSRRGLVVHRTSRPLEAAGSPPRTTVALTVLALCAKAKRRDDVTALLARTAQQYPGELDAAVDAAIRHRGMRWRAEFLRAAADVRQGAHSVLERAYLVGVERAHGLPTGQRQRAAGGTRQDVHYRAYLTTVELDGRAVHQTVSAAWSDRRRDNAATERGEVSLRYGWDDVRYRPCEVAAQVAAVLHNRGWQGHPRPCGPHCAAARP